MRTAHNVWLLAVFLALACPAATFAQERKVPDLRKCIIEVPLKRTISTATPPKKLDERVICYAKDGTPKVEPGKVKWLQDFESAKRAAAASHKPVLMFAMLGNLDDKFC